MCLTPVQARIVKCLLLKPCTSRELMFDAGCNNPPDYIQYLRKDFSLDIETIFKQGLNRDGHVINYGEYVLHAKKEALELLEEVAAPSNNSNQTNNGMKADEADSITIQ